MSKFEDKFGARILFGAILTFVFLIGAAFLLSWSQAKAGNPHAVLIFLVSASVCVLGFIPIYKAFDLHELFFAKAQKL